MRRESLREALEKAAQAMEAQRAALGSEVVDAALAALREKLAREDSAPPCGPAQPARRQVTILAVSAGIFSQAAGLAEDTSAGRAQISGEALLSQIEEILMDSGGAVQRQAGGLAAVWGISPDRPGDPEQAVRAALAVQARTAAQNCPGVQIGIHTTSAEIRQAADATSAPFLAADSLRRAAPEGGILISHDTLRYVRGVFRVSPAGEIPSGGGPELLPVYQVHSAYPRAFRLGMRGIAGVETSMVGREDALAAIQDVFRAVTADGLRRLVTITGEAGVGKSRLIYEFEKWIDLLPEPVWYFKGRACQDMEAIPFALFRDVFNFRFQIQDDDPLEEAARKFEAGFCGALGAGEAARAHAHLAGHLLGYNFSGSPFMEEALRDPALLRSRGIQSLSLYFDAVSALHPAVVLLEDLHWADDSSLELLESLAVRGANQRVLLVCAARPALFERRPGWGHSKPFHTHLALQPLSGEASLRLAQNILRRAEAAPDELIEIVVKSTAGNPYFMEELVRLLIDDGIIRQEGDRWLVEEERLAVVRVPASLEGVLQARLGGLTVSERELIRHAAIIGTVFWDEAAGYVSGQPGGAFAAQTLQDLAGREMVFRRQRSSFNCAGEYIFKHSMLRDTAYQSIPRRERRALHARAAGWLAAQYDGNGREGERAGQIAINFDLAGEAPAALDWYIRAARHASARAASREARRCLSRALELAGERDAEKRFELLLERERASGLLGDLAAQLSDLDELEGLAQLLGGSWQQAEAALRRARYALASGDFARAAAAAQRAAGFAREISPPAKETEAEAVLIWGQALSLQGSSGEAREKFEAALRIAGECGAARVEAACLYALAGLTCRQGDFSAAKAMYEQALGLFRALADRRGEGDVLLSLGRLAASLRDYPSARVSCEQCLEVRRAAADRHGEGSALCELGGAAMALGDYALSRRCFEQALSIFVEMDDRQGQSAALNSLGSAAFEWGDYAAALAYLERALASASEIGGRPGECSGLVRLSLAHHGLGEDEQALAYARRALELAAELGLQRLRGQALAGMGSALLGLGRIEEAAAAYQGALEASQELGQAGPALEARAGLVRAALLQNDMVGALAQALEIYYALEGGPVEGMEEPSAVYLAAYKAFKAAGDKRAARMLRAGWRLLQERAERIPDPLMRRSYLESTAGRRELADLAKSI